MPLQNTPSALPAGVRKLLVARIESNLELPLQSTSSAQVMALCNDEECDASTLSDVIAHDQALAGHVLSVSNSATYAPKEPIVSLQQAVSRLGISTICEIAVAVSLKGKVFDVPGHAVRIREMWLHSAAAAMYAKEVARHLGMNVEGAFLCGLLHDVGKPIVLQNLVDMARAKTDKPVPQAILAAAMDEFHEPVGARMVRHWELPEWMAVVVEHHHDCDLAEELEREAQVTLMSDHLANWALGEGESDDYVGDPEVHSGLGLGSEDIQSFLGMRGRVRELVEAFL